MAVLDDQEGDRRGVRARCAPGEEMKPLEAAARSRSEADWVVGMNATRAASDPPARRVRRRRLARPGADADAGAGRPPRGGDPRLQARAVLARRGEVRGDRRAPLLGPLPGRQAAPAEDGGAPRSSRRSPGQPGEITKLEKKEEREQPQLLYDLTSLQRHANTLYGFSARRTLAAAQRLYEEHKALTYPRTNSRFLTGDMVPEIKPTAELVGHNPQYRRASEYVLGARQAAARPRGQRQEGPGPPRDHPHRAPSTTSAAWAQDELKVYDLVAEALPGDLPPRGRVRAHARRDHRRRARLPHQRAAADRGRLEGRLRRGGRPAARRRRLRRRPAAAQARAGRDRGDASRSSRCARRPSRRGASPTPRCWARWRPPARRSRTPSCARR